MSAISNSFNTSFGLAGSLGVGTASILGANASTSDNAASVIAAGSDTADGGALSVLSSAVTANDESPTIAALTTGKLTEQQQKILSALGSSTTPTEIPWNTDGSEPTELATLRSLGWIKVAEPTYDEQSKAETGASYQLTPVGQAINRRTGGGEVGTATAAAAAAAANSVDVTA